MFVKFPLQLLKYFGVGFFIMMLYAAIMGKDNLIEYQLGSKLLIEEYCIILIHFIRMVLNMTNTLMTRKRVKTYQKLWLIILNKILLMN